MNKLKVIKIDDEITFDNGWQLVSYHSQDCCESHDLYFRDLSIQDFDGLEFDLSNDNFFKRVEGYGIELLPLHGHPVRIAGHGSNNGYYSSHIDLSVRDADGNTVKTFDVSECQDIQG